MRRGRPRLFDEPLTEEVRVRVTKSQRAALERAARANRTDLSGVIRDAADSYQDEYGAGPIFAGFRRNKKQAVQHNPL